MKSTVITDNNDKRTYREQAFADAAWSRQLSRHWETFRLRTPGKVVAVIANAETTKGDITMSLRANEEYSGVGG